MISESVQDAISELTALYSAEGDLLYEGDGEGGAFVVVRSVKLESQYNQRRTWVGFHITHACPFADTYPHFVRPDLTLTSL